MKLQKPPALQKIRKTGGKVTCELAMLPTDNTQYGGFLRPWFSQEVG